MTHTIALNPRPEPESPWRQPILGAELVLRPMMASDVEPLYKAASDPLIWEGHPNRDRYTREGFARYFDSGLLAAESGSGGAYLVLTGSGDILGCSRFYDWNRSSASIFLGYTFIVRKAWGSGVNTELKRLMLGHAFAHVDEAQFHVHVENLRSQKSLARLALRFGIGKPCEDPQDSKRLIYRCRKQDFFSSRNQAELRRHGDA